MTEIEAELKEIVRACLQEDRHARTRFQDLFGESIYNYPVKMFRLAPDKAGDFYVYVFEDNRIFRRLRGFEGRNGAHFKTYLEGYVLRDLFREWRRSQKELETISLETIVVRDESAGEGGTLEDFIADPADGPEILAGSKDQSAQVKNLFEGLALDKRVTLKLLHAAEVDLVPEEIRFVCRKSGRCYSDVIRLVEQMRGDLRKKDEQFSARENQLDSVFGWILINQKDLAYITEQLVSVSEGSRKQTELKQRKDELERKLSWRYRQRAQLVKKRNALRVTTSYKDIATLLNVPLGTVCSLVARTRTEALETLGGSTILRQAAAI